MQRIIRMGFTVALATAALGCQKTATSTDPDRARAFYVWSPPESVPPRTLSLTAAPARA